MLTLILFVLILVSIVALLEPLPRLWLPTRKRAGGVLFVALLVASFRPAENTDQEKPEPASAATKSASIGQERTSDQTPEQSAQPETESAEALRIAARNAIEVGRLLQAEQRAATEITNTPCTPTKLSPAAVELVRMYEQLHTFKDDIKFLDMGFSPAGPYHAWMKAAEAHQDRTGFEILDEVGFMPSDVLMLAMDYISEDPSESTLSSIEHFETKIQAGLALARCEEPGTAVQDIASTTTEARRAYVSPTARPPARADDIDERIINPCLVAAAAHNGLGDIDPWKLRNLYLETFGHVVAEMRALAEPILSEFGTDKRSRDILFDKFRDDCIRGARGEMETTEWSEAEVLKLLSLSQEEATQHKIPLRKANGEPYFPEKLRHCDSPWIEHRPTTSDPEAGRHMSDVGWYCESTERWCQTLQGEIGREQGFFTCSGPAPFGYTTFETAPWTPTSIGARTRLGSE